MTSAARPASLMAALRPRVQAHLYDFYDKVRTAEDLYWDRPIMAWVATSHEIVSQGAADPRLSSVRYPDLAAVPEELRPLASVLDRQMLYSDAPDHSRIRGLVSKAFTARRVEQLRQQITAAVEAIIVAALPRGRMDVVADLAVPLPMTVICELLDVPAEDHGRVKAWSAQVAKVIGNARLAPPDNRAATQSMDEMLDYFRWLLARQSTNSSGSLLHGFLTAQDNGTHLSQDELLANSVLLLIAGHETTTHFIGNAVLALLQHPDELRRLIREPELMPAAIEELLRFDSPVQLLLRRAKHDLELAGRTISKGQPVLLVCGAANRDPAVFADPHRLDLQRSGARQLAFGHGPHFCLGAGLARLEGEIAIRALITALPDLRLEHDQLVWQRSLNFRGLDRLDVVFTASAGT
jgi:hypothetical protein